MVRGTAEREKPNATRFREYTDAALPRLEQQLGAKLPVYPELEILRLGNSLERMREWLGPDHPVVRKLLAKESPADLARRVVTQQQARRSRGAHGAVEGRQRRGRGVDRSA